MHTVIVIIVAVAKMVMYLSAIIDVLKRNIRVIDAKMIMFVGPKMKTRFAIQIEGIRFVSVKKVISLILNRKSAFFVSTQE